MKRLAALLVAACTAEACASSSVHQDGAAWTLENQVLSVSLDSATGALTVRDKQTGATFRQPDSVRDKLQCAPGQEVVVLPAAGPITLDARLEEWAGTRMTRLDPTLLSDEKPWQLDGDRDLSAAVGFRWDKTNLHALFTVADDTFAPGTRESKEWWEADSVEWRVGWDQAGFMLDAKDPGGFLWGEWKDWAKAAVRPVADFAAEPEALALAQAAGLDLGSRSGYVVETSTTIGALITLQPVAAGRRFRIAFGVNDADEPGKRSAQEYFPGHYVIGRSSTYAVGVLAEADGSAPTIPDGRPPLCSDVGAAGDDALTYVLAADMPEATVGRIRCTVRLPEGSRDLQMSASFVEGWNWGVPLFRGFLPEADDAEYVAAAYGNGILIPASNLTPPIEGLSVFGSLDVPALGIVSSKGSVLCLFDDYDLTYAQLQPGSFGERQRLAVVVNGDRNKGERLPEYRTTWHFAAENGYVRLAKRVREFCAAQGWAKTLREKRAQNPNMDRLIGAPDVWGSNGLQFAREARAAGIDHLLVSGSYPKDQIEGIKALGYLVGEYSQYVDTDENTQSYDGRTPTEAYVRIQEDGQRAQGWVTLDGSHRWFSRCSETALAGAQHEVPKVLAERPYNARFLDVHTAMGLVECYSQDHPCTRTEDRENKTAMLQWIRDQGLVIGGEHGRAWSAGVLDYQEGMMSGNIFFSWPAGHLVKVEKPEEISDRYLEWGIGYAHRVPFWELAFHDCVVSTWYWGDSIGYLERVRPDLTDRKVAFTALYGAAPLLWATDLDVGFTGEGKRRFLQAYRNCCKIQEAVGYEEMVSHEFLTADRSVQRTRFGNGTTVTANFGPEPAKIESAGKTWLVPTNGIIADGPTIHQHIALIDGKRKTYIERPGYRFLETDDQGEVGNVRAVGPVTAQRLEPGRIRITLEPGTKEAAVDPRVLDEAWKPRPCRLIGMASDLEARGDVPVQMRGRSVILPARGEWQTFDLIYGAPASVADVGWERVSVPTGAPLREVKATLRNRGGTAARAKVTAYWDAIDEARLAGRATAKVEGGQAVEITIPVDTKAVDGTRRLMLVADSGADELITSDNRTSVDVTVTPDLARWPWRLPATLDLGGIERTDAVAECDVDLTPLLDGRALDPNSVRVALTDERDAPTEVLDAQFEPAPDYDARTKATGELLAVCWGQRKADVPLRCVVLAAPEGSGLLPPALCLDPKTHVVTRETYRGMISITWREGYRANVSDGAIRPLSFVGKGGSETPLIKQIIFSSMETGWGETDTKLQEFTVLADGPVRTRVRTVTELRGGLVVTRIYSFYPDYFTVEASAPERQSGLFSRIWYEQPGTYEDDRGTVRQIDGQGQEEGVGAGYTDPKWFCYYNDQASHACIALSPMDGQSFWDDSVFGQLGFSTRGAGGTYAHAIGGPQKSADFAKEWYAALTNPPMLRIGE
ncbi:MAG: hypothetical protein FJX75_21270 [Armatimonadetes bacterium]|nr:hypothetical protein [Armatimonadota bacterium]